MTDTALQDAAPSAPLVLSKRDGSLLVLTLNNPARRNALSMEMVEALHMAIREAEAPEVRAVILAHRGNVFSSGHNMKELVGASEEAIQATFARSAELMKALRRLPKPVIARVSGLASAAGLQLAASCDLLVASTEAGFQTPGVQIGLFCTTPMVPLARAVPPKKALEMLFTGRPVSAAEAERMGLVSRVVAPERLAEETLALARDIVQYSGDTLARGKAAFYEQLALSEDDAYAVACPVMSDNAASEDAQEGMSAFLEKRKAHFRS